MSIPVIRSYTIPSDIPESRAQWQADPGSAVLLIHDMQDYFLQFYEKGNRVVDGLLANLIALRNWAREHSIPVVYTAQPAHQAPEERALLNDLWGPGLTAAGEKYAGIVSAIAPEENDTLLPKRRYSAFQRSHLEALMRDWGRDQLIIGGVYAHIGCMATALDAFMRDIKPFLVADAVADFSAADHRRALEYVASCCGVVVTTSRLISPTLQVSYSWLTEQILPLLEEDSGEPDSDDNLVDCGLDSIRLMQLASRWQQLGIRISFEELAREPSLANWWKLLQKQQRA